MKSRHILTLSKGRRIHGFGLIELMVGIVISLLVVLAITSMFLVQKKSYSTQDDLSRLQENARAMVQGLSGAFRMAGYWDASTLNTFAADAGNGFAQDQIINGTNGTGAAGVAASDSFTVRFYGASNLASPPVADGSVVDCAGNSIDKDTMVTERFSIQDFDGVPSLACKVNAAAAIQLFPDVESMQILYGEDTDNDGSVNRFRPAGSVNMVNVKSVMLSFVMRTETTNHPSAANLTFNHFGEEYAPDNEAPADDAGSVLTVANDHRIRKQFSFSIGLRNRLD